ncbi:TetR/AcrR family transcriptional regulator [Gordonia sp. DT219]|uniref:TetR/AcrR family transcriptional regulator n=1 Tax=Gordonia sp. DT219 TaxID=3416658 RepID=UPI003CF44865
MASRHSPCALAAQLHLRPMALYYYVPTKTALLALVLGEVINRIGWTSYSGPPRDRILAQSLDLHRSLAAIEWIPDLLHYGTTVAVPPLAPAENVLSACHDLGLDDAEAFGLWRTIWSIIASELEWNASARLRRGQEIPDVAFSTSDVADYPHATRVFGRWGEWSSGYDIKPYLAALVDGVVDKRRRKR